LHVSKPAFLGTATGVESALTSAVRGDGAAGELVDDIVVAMISRVFFMHFPETNQEKG
jgi:hypothetical protein